MVVSIETAVAGPRSVLLLHSFGPYFSPWGETAESFRAELLKQSPDPIDLYEASVFTARFEKPQDELAFIDYLRSLFSGRKLDLIVPIGGPAASFVQHHRPLLFPDTPLLITGVAERRISKASLTTNDTVVALALDLSAYIGNILRLRPDTANIAVVIGNSPLEQYWISELRREFLPLTERVTFTWLNNLPFNELLKRVASLPPRSAIFYFLMAVDVDGVSHVQGQALKAVREVATAPIFGFGDYELGRGIIGGPLNPTEALARQAAGVAVRIFNGESPAAIDTPPMGFGTWAYDWRELHRWGISESILPPGSVVRFHEPTLLELYRWQIVLIAIALLGQSLLVTSLLYQRRRRQLAEAETRQRAHQLARMNRRAVASEMSATIAHELSQPLTAILSNAEVAHHLLGEKTLDPKKIQEIVSDIIEEDTRASELIGRVRKLLRKDESKLESLDLNELVESTLRLLHGEVVKREIKVETALAVDLPAAAGDPVQLQQVLLNLLVNAMDAVGSKTPPRRLISISTRANGRYVEVDITDSGNGIAADAQKRVFEPFFTTKEQGLGLGLSICATIVKAHKGNLSIQNNDHGGATAVLSVPSAPATNGAVGKLNSAVSQGEPA
jgi:signal transduction histidine kinase